MDPKELVRSLGDLFSASATVKSVYGEPVTAAGRTVIPVARVRYGFGAGGGSKSGDSGGGGGGGLQADPAGVVEITAEGARFIPYREPRVFAAAIAAGFLAGFLVGRLTRRSD
ncbi:MAG TPA: spore germination protein GerW family protein [Bryobacteraceae bacterium]|jgi:uncharacterized spore protein YtfJ